MPKDKLSNRIKTLTGATGSEISAVLVILLGLIIGLAVRTTSANDYLALQNNSVSDEVFQSLDSLAKAEQSTFVGTDIENVADSSLVKADTIVAKQQFLGSQLPSRKDEFTGIVNLNTASRVQLMKVPGIGEKTALAIIAYRESSPFITIEDIMNIKGIGQKKFEKMKSNIRVR